MDQADLQHGVDALEAELPGTASSPGGRDIATEQHGNGLQLSITTASAPSSVARVAGRA